jgi:hypothetical protein
MCLGCFKGSAIDPLEEHFGLPFFLADGLSGKAARARTDDKASVRGEMA